MAKKSKQQYSFFSLFDRFIKDSRNGKRLQPNGKRLSSGTIENYTYTRKLLEQFCSKKQITLRIIPERMLTRRETEVEKNYWKKFYRSYTDYLYNDLGYFDNYVGATIKHVKTFFNYLNRDLALDVGLFHKQFYVRKEQIVIYALMPEELNYLIYDKDLENKLSKRLKETKDVFVFGCTVALRVSDLLHLKQSAMRVVNGRHYLSVRSKKTRTDTLVKLPDYAVEILQKYKNVQKKLLPSFTISSLNKYLKQLMKEAGFTHPVTLCRERRGKPIQLNRGVARFCDVVSTHTMRRTAITTMLCLGMPEHVVRKISGHTPGTKEFYRYVLLAQTYQDSEAERMFAKLKEKKLFQHA